MANFAAAMALVGERDFGEAEQRLLRAIELDPAAPEPYRALTRIRWQRGNLDGVLEILRRAERARPDDRETVRHIAGVYILQGRVEEAFRVLRPALRKWPDDAALAGLYCELLADRDRLPEAVAAAKTALASAPLTPELAKAFGGIVARARAPTAPEGLAAPASALLDAMDAAATQTVARAALADVMVMLGETARARKVLETEWKNDPLNGAVRDRLVRLHLADGALDPAIAVLDAAIERGSGASSVRRQLAQLLLARADRSSDETAARGDRERATALLTAEAAAEPSSVAVRAALGRALAGLGRVAEAIEVFAAVPQEEIGVRMSVVRQLARGSDTNALIRHMRRIAEERPSDRLAHYYLGELLLAAGQRKAAREEFAAAASAPEPDPPAYLRLAAMSWEDGHGDEARRWLDRGLERQTNHVGLLRAKALLFLLDGDPASALKLYEEVESLTPLDAVAGVIQVKVEQAMALQSMGRPRLAARRLAELWDPPPLAVDFFMRLSLDYARRTGRGDAADATFAELARLRPGDPLVAMYHGLWALNSENFERAVEMFEEAERFALQTERGAEQLTAVYYFSRGSALERVRRYEEAEVMLEKSVRMDPTLAEAWNYLAYMWAERGVKLDTALAYVEEALKLAPGNGAYLDTRGWIRYQQGRYAEALPDLERALSVLPEEDATVLDHIGDVLLKLGRENEAVARWKRAWVLDPDNGAIREKLEQRKVDLDALRKEAEALQQQKKANARRLTPSLVGDLSEMLDETDENGGEDAEVDNG